MRHLFLPLLLLLAGTTSLIAQSAVCYSVSEDASDNELYSYNPTTGNWSYVGQTNTDYIEAIAIDPFTNTLYATNANVLGTINVNSGLFTAKTTLGTVTGDFDFDGNANETINISDVDGLSYDPISGILWASDRIIGSGNPDILFQIDIATCTVVQNAFGLNEDFIAIPAATNPNSGDQLWDIDDIAWDPFSGRLYMIQNNTNVGGDILSYFDIQTQTTTQVGLTAVDMEGLGFNHLEQLFGVTGADGGNSFYSININTGAATLLSGISNVDEDFESVDCLSTWSDLALDKKISPTQATPISAGDNVCFDIEIYNQGQVPNYNIDLIDYIPAGLTLTSTFWTMSGSDATYRFAGPLAPGASVTTQVCFTVNAGFSGTITNTVEITASHDAAGNNLPDIDSQPDNTNNETGVVDNDINGSGPLLNEDEDDHDIALISVSSVPSVSVTSNSPICVGQNISLSENGGDADTWSWSGPNGFTSSNQNPTITNATIQAGGIYTVTITENGIINTGSVNVIVNPNPTITFPGAGPVCVNDVNSTLSAMPAGGSYSGAGIVDAAAGTFDPSSAGIGTHPITYSYTDSNGCSAEEIINIVVNGAPAVTLPSIGPFCIGDAPVALNGMPSGGNYVSTSNIGNTPGIFDPAVAGVGTHTVYYVYTDANGCTATVSIDVVVTSPQVVTLNPAGPFCIDEDGVNLVGSPAGGTYSGMGITDGSVGTFDPGIAGVGTHTIIYSVTDPSGCTVNATQDIIVNGIPNVTATPAGPFCLDDASVTLAGTPAGGVWSGTGITSASIGTFNPAVAGVGSHTITYTLTDANGCESEDEIAIVVTPLPMVMLADAGPFCVSSAAVALNGSPSGGTYSGAGITNASVGTFDPGVAGVGTHTITYDYIDANGCEGSATNSIVVNAGSTAIIDPAGPFCVDADDVTLVGTPAGGLWNGMGITNSIAGTFSPSGAGVGTHSITYTYTDPSGCQAVATSKIVVNQLPTIQAGAAICSADLTTYSIDITTSGDGALSTLGTVTGNGGGSFTVSDIPSGSNIIITTINSVTGCSTMLAVTSPDCTCPPIVAPSDADPKSVCEGNPNPALTVTVPAGMTADWWDSLTGGSLVATNITSFTSSETAAGMYTYYVEAKDPSNGCVSAPRLPIDFTIYPEPSVNLTEAGPFCDGNAATDLTGVPAGGTFTGVGITNDVSGTFDPATAGVGTHTITYTYIDANGCTNSDMIDIIINPGPTVAITAVGPFCIDDNTINLTGTPTGGMWSGMGITDGNSGQFNPAVAGAGTHTITYTITDGNGCSGSATIDIVVNALPVITMEAAGPYCINKDSENLVASPAGGVWSGTGITDIDNGTFSPGGAGVGTHDITYTITDGNGCTSSERIEITVNPLPSVMINPAGPFCEGESASNLVASPAGGNWSGVGIVDAAAGTFDPATAGVGDHTISYSYTDANGCSNSTEIDIKVNSGATVNIDPAGPYCISDPVATLVATPAGGTWSGMGILDANAGTFGPTAVGAGTHTVTYMFTDANGCDATGSLDIVVNADPSLLAEAPVCSADLLSYDVNVTLTGGDALTSTAGTVTDNGGGLFTISNIPSGTDITVTGVMTSAGCEAVIIITAPDCTCDEVNAPIEPSNPVICEGETIPALSAAVGTDETIDWYDSASGGNLLLAGSSTFSPAGSFNAGTYTYYVQTRNINTDCVSSSRTPVVLQINPLPIVSATGAGPFCETAGTIRLNGSPIGGTWSGAGITNANLGEFESSTAGVGTHTITYSFTDGNGCTNTATIDIVVNPLPVVTVEQAGPICNTADPIFLQGSPAGGTWSGVGIVSGTGQLFPDSAGVGTFIYEYIFVDPNGCSATAQTSVTIENCTYDLAIDKTITSAGPYAQGSTVTFSVVVENQGVVDANNIEVTDSPEVGLTYVSSNAGANANVTETSPLIYEITSLPAGQTETINLTFTIDAAFTGTSLTNDVQITADDGDDSDSDPSTGATVDEDGDGLPDDDDEDQEIVVIGQVYDLALVNTIDAAATPGPYAPGDNVTFDICVINQGTLPASGIEVTDYIPADMTFAGSPDFALVGTDYVATVASLPAGDTTCLSITLTIDAGFSGASIINDAEISNDDGDDVDSTPADNATPDDIVNDNDSSNTTGGDDQDPAEVVVTQIVYDLALVNTIDAAATPGPYAPGDDVTFDICVINQGTVAADSIVVTDYIPVGMSFVSSADFALVGGAYIASTSVPAGDTTCLSITLAIDSTFTGASITNDAEITHDDGDDADSTPADNATPDDIANDNDTADVTGGDDQDPAVVPVVQPEPDYDLALIKTMGPTTQVLNVPGDNITFELCVINQGGINADSVVVTDYIPAGMSFVSSADFALVGTDYIASTSVLAGDSVCLSITLAIDATFTGTSLINDAEITYDDGDDVDSTPGDNATPNDVANDDDIADTTGGDDQDPMEIPVEQQQPVYDLALVTTIDAAATPGPYAPGDNVTFDVCVINQGTVAADSVAVTDYIPAGMNFVSSTDFVLVGTDYIASTSVPAGDTVCLSITLAIDSTFTGASVINDAEITYDDGDDADSTPGDNATPDDVANDNNSADISGGDDQDPAEVPVTQVNNCESIGGEVFVDANNNGCQDVGETMAVGVSVLIWECDPATGAPSALIDTVVVTGVDGVWSYGGADASGACVLDSSITYTAQFIIPDAAGEAYEGYTFSTAAADSTCVVGEDDNVDPVTGIAENCYTLGTESSDNINAGIVAPQADYDLALVKTIDATATPGPYVPGDNVTFAVCVINQGAIAADSVVVTDYIPAGMSFVSSADFVLVGADYVAATSVLAGETSCLSITLAIDSTFTGTSIINDAEITYDDGDDADSTPGDDATPDDIANDDDTADTTGGDDQDPAEVPVVQTQPEYDLAIDKSLISAGPFKPGDSLTYQIVITNQGDLNASTISFVDVAQAGLVYVSSTHAATIIESNPLEFEVPILAAGESDTVSLLFTIDPNFTGTTLVNDVQITADDGDDIDSDPARDNTVDENGDGDPVDDDEDGVEIPVIQSNDIYDLAIDKVLTTTGTYSPGSPVSYQIVVTNQGNLDAANVQFTDTPEAGLDYLGSDAVNNSNVTEPVTLGFELASLPAGTSDTVNLIFVVDVAFTGTSLTNDVWIVQDDGDDVDSDPATDDTVDEDGDGNGDDDDEDEVTITVIPLSPDYDLAINKIAISQGPFVPGSTVSYGIAVTNQGGALATNIEVTDSPEVGLVYVSSDVATNANISETSPLVFSIDSLVGGATEGITVTFTIDSSYTGTSLVNDIQITADDGDDIDSDPATDDTVDEDGDGNPVDDDESEAVIQVDQPNPVYDLALAKAVISTGPYASGSNVMYRVTVTNEGTEDAANIELVDIPETGLNFIMSDASGNANVTELSPMLFSIASLPAGQSETITLSFIIDAAFVGTTLENLSQITLDDGGDVDSSPNNDDGDQSEDDEDGVLINVEQSNSNYDLALAKAVISTGPYASGSTVMYRVTVTNEGTEDAANIELVDIPETGLNFIMSDASGNANVTELSPMLFSIASLPAGQSETITLSFTIDATFVGATLENLAQITLDDGGDVDSEPNNDDGDQSEDDEDGVVIDVEQSNSNYDLALDKALVSTGPFAPGSTVIYTVTVINEGAEDAANIEFTDIPETGLNFIMSDASGNANVTELGAMLYSIASLPAGQSETVTLSFTIDATFVGTTLENLSEITLDDGGDVDSSPNNDDGDQSEDDEDKEVITVEQTTETHDLSLVKTVTSTGPYAPGSTVTYQIAVTNDGTANTANVEVVDVPEVGLVYQSSDAGVNANVSETNSLTFLIASLSNGQTEVINLTFTIDQNFAGINLINIAEVTAADGQDADSAPNNDDGDQSEDDEDNEEIAVQQANPVYDLAIDKITTSVAPYSPGGAVTYQIVVTNEGEVDANNIQVVDAPQSGLNYVMSDATSNANVTESSALNFEILSLQAGQSETINVGFAIDALFAGTSLVNNVQITGDDGDDVDSDPATDDNVDEDGDGNGDDDDEDAETINVDQPNPVYDLSLDKVVTSAGPYSPGSTITYQLIVSNDGMVDAANIELTDIAQAGMTYVMSDATGNANVTEISAGVYQVISLPQGQTETVTLSFVINASFTGTSLANNAQITEDDGDDVDSDPATDATIDEDGDGNGYDDDEDQEVITVQQPQLVYDLSIDKVVTSTGPYSLGSTITYAITISNDGDIDANNIQWTDMPGAGLNYVSSDAAGNANVNELANLTFEVISIPVGSSETIELSFTIDNSFAGGSLTNDAMITLDDGDDIDSDPATITGGDDEASTAITFDPCGQPNCFNITIRSN